MTNKPTQKKLLNYTTEIAADKTVGEIQRKLALAGASQVLHGYDPPGNLSELSFRIKTQFGELPFLLPANIDVVEAISQRQFRTGRSQMASREHAVNVAWHILKVWIEAQLALLRTGMVTIEQVFLPYAQNAEGQTVYEALRDRKFEQLTLEDRASPNNQTA
jgi:hypothetical protein